jgi:hypothetical protein
MQTPDLDGVAERMKTARVRWQQAKQTGDEVLIEAARAEVEAAMAAGDAALDEFEETVLGGHFRRKRDLSVPPATDAQVLPFAVRKSLNLLTFLANPE